MQLTLGLEPFIIARGLHNGTECMRQQALALLRKLCTMERDVSVPGFTMAMCLIEADWILDRVAKRIKKKDGMLIDHQNLTIQFRTVRDIFHGILFVYKALAAAGYAERVSSQIAVFQSCVDMIDGHLAECALASLHLPPP